MEPLSRLRAGPVAPHAITDAQFHSDANADENTHFQAHSNTHANTHPIANIHRDPHSN